MGYGTGSKRPKRCRCLHFGRDFEKEDEDEESKEEKEEEEKNNNDDETEAAEELLKKFINEFFPK